MCIYSKGNGKLTDKTNGQGQALEAETRLYANYESLKIKGNWKTQIMEIRERRLHLFWTKTSQFYVNFIAKK